MLGTPFFRIFQPDPPLVRQKDDEFVATSPAAHQALFHVKHGPLVLTQRYMNADEATFAKRMDRHRQQYQRQQATDEIGRNSIDHTGAGQ